MAVAADGTVYFADTDNYRVRRINTNGVIATIAGNGTFGDDGDNGQATSASLSGLLSIALSPAGNILYIADIDNNRVRQVDLGTGVIANFAGLGWAGFGFDGDGGPATSASLASPEGVAVDASGNVYIGDLFNCVVRKVAALTNFITTVAGMYVMPGLPGSCSPSGDGGNALAAKFSLPRRMTLDPAGNLFVLDSGSETVRRIDAATNIITTVAGGGSTTPGFGSATTMDLDRPSDLVLDASNNLYISTFNQVLKVDLGTGMLSVFAGTGVNGYSGDGGPAQEATFSDIGGVTARADEILIADAGNARIRAVVPPPLPDDLIIELATSQLLLDSLTAVPGSILMINVDGREYLVMPNATSVGLNVTITGNDQLRVVDLGALQSAGGSITISGNLVMQSIDLSNLATVDGSLTITGNPALNAILISGVTSIGGDLTVVGTAATVINMSALTTVGGSLNVSDNTSATVIDMGALTSTTGSLDISGNTSATVIDVGGLTTVGGNLDLSSNTSATAIDMGALTTTTGSLDISGNTSATVIDVGSLTTVGGNLDLSGNTSATAIDASSLTTTTGSLDISGNTSVTAIDVSGLTTVSGDLTIVDNGDAAVDMSAGTDVDGSLTIETTGTGAFPMGDGTVTGELTLDATGYTDISGTTPGGALDLTSTNLEAVMHLQIQAATFTTPVGFSLTRVDPVALLPESGLNASGSPATIDPVAAYQFTFAVPTLNRDATLSFDIDVAQLDAATRTALLGAVAAGTATMVTKGAAPGSAFQAFPICGSADTPTAGGCVRVEALDALGHPTSGTPAIVRFSNVVDHFSTWAVAIVTQVTQANRTVICSMLGSHWFLDVHLFEFNGVKGEKVTVTLAPNPAGTFTPGKAALTLSGLGLLRFDATGLPNTITATLPWTGKNFVTVAELPLRTGKFKGDYCVSAKSTQNAWRTFQRK
jgi:sugar lactone lactonase YvrE